MQTRRSFLRRAGAFGFALAALPRPARAADARTFTFGYDQPRDTAYGFFADTFSQKLTEMSKGTLAIRQFPSAALGQEPEMAQKIRAGDIDLALNATANTSTVVPQGGVFSLHYISLTDAQRGWVADAAEHTRLLAIKKALELDAAAESLHKPGVKVHTQVDKGTFMSWPGRCRSPRPKSSGPTPSSSSPRFGPSSSVPAAPRRRVTGRGARHLKWPLLDPLERGLLGLCALLLLGFTLVEIADVLFRNLRRPWLNANEFAAGFFVWGVFLGMGVAVRRDQHFRLTAIVQTMRGARRTLVETLNRLVILGVALSMIVFGYENYLTGFGSFLMPSLTPIAVLYGAIPVAGVLVALFTVEELINGWRRGFESPEGPPADLEQLPVT